jgi:hypothetical protein
MDPKLKIVQYYTFIFMYCCNVIKMVTVNKEFLLYKIFVLTCLLMAQVQAETCSIHVKAQLELP